jgi:hypothetical protein
MTWLKNLGNLIVRVGLSLGADALEELAKKQAGVTITESAGKDGATDIDVSVGGHPPDKPKGAA